MNEEAEKWKNRYYETAKLLEEAEKELANGGKLHHRQKPYDELNKAYKRLQIAHREQQKRIFNEGFTKRSDRDREQIKALQNELKLLRRDKNYWQGKYKVLRTLIKESIIQANKSLSKAQIAEITDREKRMEL